MRGLLAAIAFLTRIPTPRGWARATDFARGLGFYPAAGLLIGLPVAGAGWGAALLDPWLGALLALGLWVALTGALHLDGLADVADALGAAHGDRARLLAVMADPHIGSFGVVVLGLQLLAKLVLLHLLLPDGFAILIAIPAAARIGPLLWARMLPPLKPEGLGAMIAQAATGPALALWSALLLGAGLLAPPLLAAFAILPGFGLWARRRLGGMTGDVHGAGIELAETALLFAAVLGIALARAGSGAGMGAGFA